MPVTGDALRNAQPLDADQRCCADVFSVVTCSGRSARRPGSVRRLAVSRHIGRVGGPLGDDDRPFEDFDHRAGLRINPLARPGCALAAVSARKPRAALLGAAAEKSALAFEPAFYVVHVLQLHVVGERVAIAVHLWRAFNRFIMGRPSYRGWEPARGGSMHKQPDILTIVDLAVEAELRNIFEEIATGKAATGSRQVAARGYPPCQ